jgi:N utilization substance protein B
VAARTKARKRALDVLFEADQRQLGLGEVLEERIKEPGSETPLPAYSIEIVSGVIDHWHTIDGAISSAAKDWTMDRMPAVDRAVLRIATWEILHNPEVDTAVAIDEAVSLAESLSTDDSAGFINGVLGAIAGEGNRSGEADAPATDGAIVEPPASTGDHRVQ